MIRQANNIFNINNSVGYILDVDASKVIEAVRSTGVVITPAMRHYAHYLISNMKNIGTWQLSSAVYGMMGGTAASHKWNWKDLRDVDAAFRLTYSGGITHSANGMQGNGTTGYANTFLPQNFNTNLSSLHVSFNSFSNPTYSDQVEIGCWSSFGASMVVMQTPQTYITGSFPYADITFPTNAIGYRITSRTSASRITCFANGMQGGTSLVTVPVNAISLSFSILGLNVVGGGTQNISNRGCSFATIGAGLTDQQAIQQSQIVTNSQNILNRA